MQTRKIFHAGLIAAMFLFAGQGTSFGQAKGGGPNVVKASGCVEAGVEAGCLVLNSAKDKKAYNLLFGSGKNKPTAGMAISFEGKVHAGPTTCMQGTAVNIEKWTQIKMACPKPPAAGK